MLSEDIRTKQMHVLLKQGGNALSREQFQTRQDDYIGEVLLFFSLPNFDYIVEQTVVIKGLEAGFFSGIL